MRAGVNALTIAPESAADERCRIWDSKQEAVRVQRGVYETHNDKLILLRQ